MKRLLALMLAVAATNSVALGQSQTEPRLAGGPERICSADEIRQALEGSYTGSPCRFTEMPDAENAALQRPVPQQMAARPALMPTAPQSVSLRPAAGSQPVLARPEPVRPVSYSANRPANRPSTASQRHDARTVTTSQQSPGLRVQGVERTQLAGRQWPPQQPVSASGRSAHQTAPQGETVRLGDDFFSGALVGGVERPFAPVYSYRGVILIAADGQVRTGHAGPGHRVRQVRALDHATVPAPVPHLAQRRVYP
ncbi:hypothetical protein [Maricaulis sp.]|uniref:hypothetical protein n=1 Tax=Maricaulis sp. TaxID=1486257 RepID=UPI003A92629B